MFNVKFATPPGFEARLTSKFVKSFSFSRSSNWLKEFSLKWSISSKIMKNGILHVTLLFQTLNDNKVGMLLGMSFL